MVKTVEIIKSLALLDVKVDLTVREMVFTRLWSKIADESKQSDEALMSSLEYLAMIFGFVCSYDGGGLVCRKKHSAKDNTVVREKIVMSLQPTSIVHEIDLKNLEKRELLEGLGYHHDGDGKFSKMFSDIDVMKHLLHHGNEVYGSLV